VQDDSGFSPSVLPVALPLRGRPVLVLGGGAEAEDKVVKLLTRGALVTLVSEHATSALRDLAKRGRITWFARPFLPSDVLGTHLAMLTDIDEGLARQLAALRVHSRFWLCALDQPRYSDVYLVSTVMRGPVQIGISTGGLAPLLARRIREALDGALDGRFVRFARGVARLRAELRDLPREERARTLSLALNGFAMEVRLSYPPEEGSKPEGAPGAPTGSRAAARFDGDT
jgi:siroheme synthase-like protein